MTLHQPPNYPSTIQLHHRVRYELRSSQNISYDVALLIFPMIFDHSTTDILRNKFSNQISYHNTIKAIYDIQQCVPKS